MAAARKPNEKKKKDTKITFDAFKKPEDMTPEDKELLEKMAQEMEHNRKDYRTVGERAKKPPKKITTEDIELAKQPKEPKEPTSGTPKMNPGVLVRGVRNITKGHIDHVAYLIANDCLQLEEACTLSGVDHKTFNDLMVNTKDSNPILRGYANDKIRVAEAERYRLLLTEAREGKVQNRQLLEMLEPRTGLKYRTQMLYEVGIILETVKGMVDEEVYLQLIEALAEMNSHEVADRLDAVMLDRQIRDRSKHDGN